MHIAYVVERDLSAEDAIVKKIAAQARCWREMGHDVTIFALSPSDSVSSALDGLSVVQQHRRGWLDWFSRYRQLIDEVIRRQPTCAYFRFSTYFPAVGRLMRRVPTAVEVNTDDVSEYRTSMTRRAYLYHRLTRRRLFLGCRGIVTVTQSLADGLRAYGKPTTAVPNGIDLEQFPSLPPPDNDAPRLAFLGSPNMPWHGVDKVAKLAELNPDWRIDLIGPAASGFNSSAPANIHWHGYLDRDQYQPLLEKCDVAVSTLALHRNSMDDAAPLKLREYLAYGIPSIIAYRDGDFPDERPFLLRLPNTPRTIEENIDAIRQFVERAKNMRVPREAIGHLDIRQKERKRLFFFESIS
ncbi:MAG: glycosyltransferase family 4 protein [Pirellulales bacterium]